MQHDDRALVAACRAGDESAWHELIDRFGRLVYSIPRRYGMSDADADDVFQSVFTIAHRRLDALADETKLSAWLITTTHRECWRVARRVKAATAPEVDQQFPSPIEPPEATIADWERQHLVRQALTELGGPCERLLTALFLTPSERSYDQIARELGMKVGSLGPTRARCFKKLERILARMGVTGPGETSGDEEP